MNRKITLALTHFNRFDLLMECIYCILPDDRISEIVISDDCSTDGSFEKIRDWAVRHSKVAVYRNEQNQDCYRNKWSTVARSSNPWVILFDSDNLMDICYLDRLFDLREWDERTAYCPDFAEPEFDFRAFAGSVVNRHNVGSFLDRKHFTTMLNAANYFVNREQYLRVWDGSVDPHTADSIFQNYNWLAAGNKLCVVKDLRYFHRIHDGSHYKQNVHKTGNFAAHVEKLLKELK